MRPKILVGVAAAALALAIGGYLLSRPDRDGPTAGGAKPSMRPATTAAPATMTDEERRQYVKDHVAVEGLVVDADTKPGEDGKDIPIPGLLRATGKVVNKGDKPVSPITMVLHLTGAGDTVIGTYLEDVSGQRPLAPGASRDFKFTLPDKKEWSGQFKHSLQ